MKKYILPLFFIIFFTGCVISKAPVTNRNQLILLSSSQELSLGEKSYNDFLSKNKKSTDIKQAQKVKQIGAKIASVIHNKNFKWEFNLIENKQKNAFCLPGGKVIVYTGILELVENDSQLATIISHEIAHALARHGAERMSMGLVAQSVQVIGNQVVKSKYPQHQSTFNKVYGVASQYGLILPYSRLHEYEADHIGIELMYKAGYDIKEASKFWQNMQKGTKQKNNAFFSTHPTTKDRIKNINKIIASKQK